ncbi:alpha/beta hydrolase [Luteolibacter ambystomatis]|uniref:Alpha/beta hydrolase n=1 Tax=Luteolibacter ambystomatis TaxID=2824561 RepID=A0A975PH42_9BACT|nr:alpha/beta fold hydrolase [Luteolibacter ambystomatis]QUE52947.1 alpha/beta hydrolase [Luteolibacter ambystomatis]
MKRLLLIFPFIGLSLAGTEIELKTPTGVLKGTLEQPAQEEKSLVVLIHPGSGPTDRDGNSIGLPGNNDSLKMLAEGLAARGIASVRIDKRGIAASKAAGPKKEDDLLFDTYVDDAVSWIGYLQGEMGFKKVALLGHSEGALITLIAAGKKPVAGYVSLSGTAKRASPLLREQLKTKLPPNLLTESTVILQQLDQGQKVAKVSPELNVLFRPSVQPYLISWIKYTPTEEIAKLTAPALIVQGTTDIQVSPADADALHEAQPESKEVKIEGMNHVLKAVGTDLKEQVSSYSNPKLPLHPGLLGPVAEFLQGIQGKPEP